MAPEGKKNHQYLELKNISLLYVEDEKYLRESVIEFLQRRFTTIHSGANGKEGLELFKQHTPDVVITDIKMPMMDGIEMVERIRRLSPETPVIITTAFNEVPYLLKAIEIGVDKYIQKPMANDNLMEAIYQCSLTQLQKKEIERLNAEIETSLDWVLGKSQAIKEIIKQIQIVARSDFSVIIQGETGTGKSMVAAIIHNQSRRTGKPFVTLDVGAVPESLVESELFGHERGAFTGADKKRKGFFELAHGGTLFLDDIENITPYVQSKLLRAVEDRMIFPVGSAQAVAVDARFLCATNKNIMEEVKDKKFREDLFYRLGEFIITIPPLRERKGDIPFLARKFMKDAADELNRPICDMEDHIIDILADHQWPGNVRELKNVIRKLALFCEHGKITTDNLRNFLVGRTPEAYPFHQPVAVSLPPLSSLQDIETWAIHRALAATNGNKTKAAAILQIDYKTLLRKIKAFQV